MIALELKMKQITEYAILRMTKNENNLDLISQGWGFRFNNRIKRCIAWCHHGRKLIELSTHFLTVLEEHEWKDIINHEIAHAMVPKNGHNKIWQEMAIKLGATPSPEISLMKYPDPIYVLYFKNKNGEYEIAKTFNRKPTKNFQNSYVTNRRAETHGKLMVSSFKEYTELSTKERTK